MSISCGSAAARRMRMTVLTRVAQQTSVAIRTNMTSRLASYPIKNNTNDSTVAKPFEELPGPKGIYNIPYVGFAFHLKPFTKHTTGKIHLFLDELIERYGRTIRIQTDQPSVLISTPADAAAMMRIEGKYPHRPTVEIIDVYNKRNGLVPDVNNIQGEGWFNMRKPIQKAVSRPQTLRHYVPEMNQVADHFVQKVSNGYLDNGNTFEGIMAYVAESAGLVVFNRSLGFLGDRNEEQNRLLDSFNDTFDILLDALVGNSYLFKFYRDKDYIRFESARNYQNQKLKEYVKDSYEDIKRKQKMGVFNEQEPNVLFSLIKDTDVEEAARLLEGVYLASIDTSASALQQILFTLAKHPDKQEKIRQETHATVGLDQPITRDALDNMPYLKASITEVYRMQSPAPFNAIRKIPNDTVLGGYRIPAGTQIYNYSQVACRDPKIFPEPEKYTPERWLRTPDGDRTKRTHDVNDFLWSVVPFGIGARSCVGRRLFEQEAQITIAKILQKLKVGLKPESENTEFEYKLFWKPVKNIDFTFTALNDLEKHHSMKTALQKTLK